MLGVLIPILLMYCFWEQSTKLVFNYFLLDKDKATSKTIDPQISSRVYRFVIFQTDAASALPKMQL